MEQNAAGYAAGYRMQWNIIDHNTFVVTTSVSERGDALGRAAINYINTDPTVGFNSFSHNTIREKGAGTYGHGILITNGDYTNVIGNQFYDLDEATTYGPIRLRGCNFCKISDNILYSCNTLGITEADYGADTTDHNTIVNNIIKAGGIITIISEYTLTDYHPVSVALDLSGAATDVLVFHADHACQLLGYTLTYTEASSADAGVTVEVGRYQDGVALDDDYFDQTTSEVTKNLGYSKFIATTDLTNKLIVAGDTVTVGTAGGKVGTGEVIITLKIARNIEA